MLFKDLAEMLLLTQMMPGVGTVITSSRDKWGTDVETFWSVW